MVPRQLRQALVCVTLDAVRRAEVTASSGPRQARPRSTVAAERSVTLKLAIPADAKRLARLAALDSSSPLTQPSLVAEVDGQLLAALGLSDGAIIADPFHHTAHLIDLLRARAHHLDAHRPAKRSARFRFWTRCTSWPGARKLMPTRPPGAADAHQ